MSPREPFDVIDGGLPDEALFVPAAEAPPLDKGIVLPFPAQAYSYAHGPRLAVALVDARGRATRFDTERALYEILAARWAPVLADEAGAARFEATLKAELARRAAFDAAPAAARAQFILVGWIEDLARAAAPLTPWALAAGAFAALVAYGLGGLA